MGALNLHVNAMVLSKDKKIAFVTLDYYGALQIIDISDLQSPFVIGSLNLELLTDNFRIRSLILSSDADLASPKLISYTKSEIFGFNFWESTSK